MTPKWYRTWRSVAVALTLSASAARATAAAEPTNAPRAGPSGRPTPELAAGRAAYTQHCARCHGAQGHGDGLDAKRFYPRPRDVTLGVYKFRSTASGTPPTDEDLFRTITDGLPGTNMPDWRHLDDSARWQLVYYLKSLSLVFQQTQPSPVTVAQDPGPHDAATQGKALYEKLGCAACHGTAGRANGPSAAGLVDDWGMPIRPANLTQGWAYRGGHDARSIMLRMLTGIDGAGMPSYAEVVSPQEAWQLAHYVERLQEPAHWNLIIRARPADGALPLVLEDPRWAQADRTDVRLRQAVAATGEWVAPATIKSIAVDALATNDAVAFRFTWDDPSESVKGSPDAFALLLKPAKSAGDVVTLHAWPYVGAPALDLCAWRADTGQATEELATTFHRVFAPSRRQVSLPSTARYADGRWQLILHRALQSDAPGTAVIGAAPLTSVAFAVWDGENAQARAVSPWVDLALRRKEEDAP